ncbi:putative nuclease of restriction endonuclease-like (RecB) superfamily [Runella defluvii]|uniref:Putative nuclease of restriction endonuclease-like (RecB) superfamily n=1 Tax=Runella defluvii TaxID=370973 RepID=A0A7W5ZNC7_9BACT|nr:PDDEXK nuclease domain-containing protein [Runella defluvii]MBB3840114.1 putative nuclease of restriction endonuclease-like (RecB) superfamily [Runella defluvii]
MNNDLKNNDILYDKVAQLIEQARKQVATAVNLAMVHTYFEIGRMIVEDEQQGKQKAQYGKYIIKDLAKKLNDRFGKGFSEVNLRQMRAFYEAYSIQQTQSAELGKVRFTLSWSHYLVLMRIPNPDERSFYEIEATNNNWKIKELERQYHSSLYQRLALSRDKEGVKLLSQKGQIVTSTLDVLKDPYVLEFLGLKEEHQYSESQLETRIIDNLQYFMLELGKGFAFVGRQVRFSFDESHFKVDLVFYNRLLQCFVLIDLKIGKLTHQDLGQMQMYVNYYDRYEKQDYEKPTIGILLCQQKNDALVELTLPKDANIYAAEYSLYLPEKQLLQQKLNEWATEFENNLKNDE